MFLDVLEMFWKVGHTVAQLFYIASSFKFVDSHDARITAMIFQSNAGPILVVCVYMPTDYGDLECADYYSDICAQITSMYTVMTAMLYRQ